jgi:hypothetical protein
MPSAFLPLPFGERVGVRGSDSLHARTARAAVGVSFEYEDDDEHEHEVS